MVLALEDIMLSRRPTVPPSAVFLAVSILVIGHAAPAHADEAHEPRWEYAPLRFGVTGSLGALLVRPDPPVPRNQNGYDGVPFSAFVGVDVRVGLQLARWVAVDAEVFGQSAVLTADARTAAFLEIAPMRQLAFAVGAGVGAVWLANFFFPSPTANFKLALARVEVRLPAEPSHLDWAFGVEGFLGETHRGTVPSGSQVVGGRLFAGFLWH